MAGRVHIPWYATGFRGDQLEAALEEIAPVALRYGATDYAVYRFATTATSSCRWRRFEEKVDWERYWYGPEFSAWRADYSSWYQVPVLYTPMTLIAEGALGANGNGVGAAAAQAD